MRMVSTQTMLLMMSMFSHLFTFSCLFEPQFPGYFDIFIAVTVLYTENIKFQLLKKKPRNNFWNSQLLTSFHEQTAQEEMRLVLSCNASSILEELLAGKTWRISGYRGMKLVLLILD